MVAAGAASLATFVLWTDCGFVGRTTNGLILGALALTTALVGVAVHLALRARSGAVSSVLVSVAAGGSFAALFIVGVTAFNDGRCPD